MKTYQKTFWKNAHGIEVPVALEDWPREAMFLTLNKDGFIMYWKHKPHYDEDFRWFGYHFITLAYMGETKIINDALHIWERPQ
jgi:hypothetical protein